jgi:hypothetical protein
MNGYVVHHSAFVTLFGFAADWFSPGCALTQSAGIY